MTLDSANDSIRPRLFLQDAPNIAPILSADDNNFWSSMTNGSSNSTLLAPLEITGGDQDNRSEAPYMVTALAHVVRPQPWDSNNPTHLHRDGTDFEARGDNQSAQRCFQRLVNLQEEQMRQGQGQPLHLAQALDDLARVHQRQGNTGGAEPLLTRALELNREHRQGNDPQLAFSMQRLGEFYESTQRPQMATGLYQDSLNVFERHNNPNLVREAQIRLGLNYQTTGNQGEAMRTFQRVIEASPNNSVQQAEGRALLALTQARLGQTAEANQTLQQALDRRRNGSSQALDRFLINTLQGMAELARPNKKLGLPGDGPLEIARLEQADQIAREGFGENSREFARARWRLGMTRVENGFDQWGFGLMEQALHIQERILGEAHPENMETRQGIIDNLMRFNNPGAAENLARRHLLVTERLRGANHPAVATAMDQVSSCARQAGNLGAAIAMAQRAANIRQQHSAQNPSEYAYSLIGVATLQTEANLPVDAVLTTTRLADFVRANMANQPDILAKFLSHHAAALRANGMEAQADKVDDEVQRLYRMGVPVPNGRNR